MEHYLLFKFKADYPVNEFREDLQHTYRQINEQIDGIEEIRFAENVYDRKSNADLMIYMRVSDQNSLEDYLNSQVHKEFVNRTLPYLEKTTTFDCSNV